MKKGNGGADQSFWLDYAYGRRIGYILGVLVAFVLACLVDKQAGRVEITEGLLSSLTNT